MNTFSYGGTNKMGVRRRKRAVRSVGNTIHWLGVVALLIAAIAILSKPASAATSSSPDEPERYIAQWGTSGPGQLSSPLALAVNTSTGSMYVLDINNNSVTEFSSDGTYITKWGSTGSGDGQLNLGFPCGIAVNPNTGDVYVSDVGNSRIQEFTGDGTYVRQWGTSGTGNGELSAPFGVAVNPRTGNVYVVDDGNSRIQEFTGDGTYVAQWGSLGTGNGQFSYPDGIAVNPDTGNVYVTDGRMNQRIEEFTSAGSYITQWGTSGSGNGQFQFPFGVAVDPDTGNVYVADLNLSNIQVFTSAGSYITQWGTSGSGNGEFNQPYGVAVNPAAGAVYVADRDNARIQEFRQDKNLAQETIPGSTGHVSLTLPAGSSITSESVATPSAADGSYAYPLGLFSVTFAVADGTVGATVPVQLTFQTALKPSQVVARKYNPTTHVYATIPGATVTSTTVDGSPALLLSYDVTDGGIMDEDGLANGVIVDPVGLAALPGATLTATGINISAASGAAASLIVLGGLTFAWDVAGVKGAIRRIRTALSASSR